MKILIHDRNKEFHDHISIGFDRVLHADGRYAPCQGCFHCWTKNPASCEMKDSLHGICRILGEADELTIVTENWYGGYNPKVKNLLDRSIGTSTPISTYRGKEMHHGLRYGEHVALSLYVYGDISENEKKTWNLMVERNAVNVGFRFHKVFFIPEGSALEDCIL